MKDINHESTTSSTGMFFTTSPKAKTQLRERWFINKRQQQSQEIGMSRSRFAIRRLPKQQQALFLVQFCFRTAVLLSLMVVMVVVVVSGFSRMHIGTIILHNRNSHYYQDHVSSCIVDYTATDCTVPEFTSTLLRRQLLHRKVSTTTTTLFYEAKASILSSSIPPTQQQQTTMPSITVQDQKEITQQQQQQQRRDQPSSSSSTTTTTTTTTTMAHYYPSSSRQKKVTSRKIQLRWITQTVQKLILRNHNNINNNSATTTTTENNNNNNSDTGTSSMCNNATASFRLLEGLELLCMARTPIQVIEAGRIIESVNVRQTQSIPVQERIVKATAMTGLLHIALQLMDHMIYTVQYVPSPICQDAVSNALRRAGRIQQLDKLLNQLGCIAHIQNKSISLITFNTNLAALCDVVTGKYDTAQQQQQQQQQHNSADMTSLGAFDISVLNDTFSNKIAALDRAWYCIADLDRTKLSMAIVPDSVSYATVIQAASYIGNQTIVDAVWDVIRTRNVHPNIVAYNARLRSSTNVMNSVSSGNLNNNNGKSTSRLGRMKKRDEEVLHIWDTEISSDPYVSTDKYTIDLLLLPLIRSGRVGDVESLLDNFIKRNSDSVVSNAFTAFLLTVVAGDELSTARALFEMYILPTLSPVVFGDAGGMIRMVRPTTRHFNVLIEGYRKYYQNNDRSSNDTTSVVDATVQAWALYYIMTKSLNAKPDSYTTTSMMGLCRTPTELSDLIFQSIFNVNIECSSVVLRAALTAYGDLGDASSAIWLFSKYAPTTARTWNVLLGALAKVAENAETYQVNPTASAAAIAFQDSPVTQASGTGCNRSVLQQESNIFDVVQMILKSMCNQEEIDGVSAPSADSQTFCVAAAALQYGPSTGSKLANDMFHEATKLSLPADGRFVNAAMRCFGDDVDAALIAWRDSVRPKCIAFEKRSSSWSSGKKNLIAAYNGLLYVCGRKWRPDIALRVVYAMNKDGIEPNETSLNSYRSGTRVQQNRMGKTNDNGIGGFRTTIERTLKLSEQFESLLVVECTKYDQNDRRRDGEQRVRIIL